MAEAPATIDVQLEAEDYVAAQRLHNRWTRKKLTRLAIGAAIGLFLLVLPLQDHGAASGIAMRVIGGGLLGGVIGGALAFETARRLVVPRRARRIFAQQKNLQAPYTMSWNADGIRFRNERGESTTPWDHFRKRREDERLHLLYLSDILFQMLPKRAFPDAATRAAFEADLARVPPG